MQAVAESRGLLDKENNMFLFKGGHSEAGNMLTLQQRDYAVVCQRIDGPFCALIAYLTSSVVRHVGLHLNGIKGGVQDKTKATCSPFG